MNILAVDVGGTNISCAIIKTDNNKFCNCFLERYSTQAEPSLIEPLKKFLDSAKVNSAPKADVICISGAGPLTNKKIVLTNAPWSIDGDEIEKHFSMPCFVINDFTAVAWGVIHLKNSNSKDLVALSNTPALNNHPIVIIGAGTGLGFGFALQTDTGIKVYPSEGGHVTLPSYDDESRLFAAWLQKKYNSLEGVGAEAAVSGQGIVNIFNFLLEKSTSHSPHVREIIAAKDTDKPALISSGAANNDTLCFKVMDMFIHLYARVVADAAAIFLPFSGIYLAGGISAKNIDLFTNEQRFIKYFSDAYRNHIKTILAETPLYIVSDYNVSLYGAANAVIHIQQDADKALAIDMQTKGIDIKLTQKILNGINSGLLGTTSHVNVVDIPPIDGTNIIQIDDAINYSVDANKAAAVYASVNLQMPASLKIKDGKVSFNYLQLAELGEALYSVTAWGVLNGGSATSYADVKKNKALGADVFNSIQPQFNDLSKLCEGRPKGLTPAYVNPDGSVGESFLLLKMRIALLRAESYIKRFGPAARPPLAFFQMTSDATDKALAADYANYSTHPWLKDLIAKTKNYITEPLSAKQNLLAAFTHSSCGMPKRIFNKAWGQDNSALALPGGHGQSFAVLEPVYKKLLEMGYIYAYIGNVDNIGYYPCPIELAIMALSGAEAAFEFSYRTPVDIKGGILITTDNGRKTVVDIGQAISFDTVLDLESSGKKILFNCATGLFNLKSLVPKINNIVDKLPIRISDQDKDAGMYSQAEQSTWEVIGLIDKPLGFAVKKSDRFLAAKLLAETILSSGLSTSLLPHDVADAAQNMSSGLNKILENACGLKMHNGRWVNNI